MAEASFDFQMANFQMVRSPDSPYLAAVLVRALEGIQGKGAAAPSLAFHASFGGKHAPKF
jgi:hypothetical protein